MDSLLAHLLCLAVDASGCALLVGLAGRVVGFLAEDVVGGDVNEPAAHLLHGLGQDAGGCGVQLLDQRIVPGSLCRIDISPGGTVHDGLHVAVPHHGSDSIGVGDVQVDGLRPILLADVGEDIIVRGVFRYEAYFVAQLSVGSCDKNVHYSVCMLCLWHKDKKN